MSLAYTSLEKETTIDFLEVKGTFPRWLSGMLVRNGPAKFEVGKRRLHWLDGLAMLHLFSFEEGKVSYANKFLRSAWYESVMHEGKLPYRTFASDPCRSLFRSFFSLFYNASDIKQHSQNTNVNVVKIAEHYVALTEVPLSIEFDPKTLETLGVFRFQDHLEQKLRFESAHPLWDHDLFNFYIKWGAQSSYNFFRVPPNSVERQLIASIPVLEPAYMHSFAVTENYLILTEQPFLLHPNDLVLKNRPFIDNFRWLPERKTRFLIVDKAGGSLRAEAFGDPFFAFHHVNAFESGGKVNIDLIAYADPSLIWKKEMLLRSDKNLVRFEIDLKSQHVLSHKLSQIPIEMPRIHERLIGRDYRYVFGIGAQGELLKMDVGSGKALSWKQTAASAGEPIFVKDPDGMQADSGVILSVILDFSKRNSFLLVLDAETFSELARAELPHAIPYGLHGQFFGSCTKTAFD